MIILIGAVVIAAMVAAFMVAAVAWKAHREAGGFRLQWGGRSGRKPFTSGYARSRR